LLAAGSSDRLGEPKQLLTYNGKSFLENMIAAAMEAQLDPIVVVLGAYAPEIARTIDDEAVQVVENKEWNEGIASSIRYGIGELEKRNPAVDAAILMVCDQPHLTSNVLKDIRLAQEQSGNPVVAAYYNGVAGTPALFHKSLFPELLLLTGDRGARKFLREHADLMTTVSFPLGIVDIDTKDHYEKLKQNT